MSSPTPKDSEEILSPEAPVPEPPLTIDEQEIPWKPPVISAVVGALVVALFAIYAVTTGPSADEADEVELSQRPPVSSETSGDLPTGYLVVSESLGARIDAVEVVPSATFLFVSTAARSSSGASAGGSLEVAYWELSTPSSGIVMQRQYETSGLGDDGLRLVTIEFPWQPSVEGGELLAYQVQSSTIETTMVEVVEDLPAVLADIRIALPEGDIVIETLEITDVGGYVEWRVEGALPVRLDVVVRSQGDDQSEPSNVILAPSYVADDDQDPPLDRLDNTEPAPLPYSFASSFRLVPVAPTADLGSTPATLIIEFRVAAVTSVANPSSLPIK